MQVYSTPNDFMTRSSFENYFQNIILNYIQKACTKIRNKNESTLFIFDGFKSGISDVIFAKYDKANVSVVTIQSNSFHVLQPLDLGVFFFSPLKYNYSLVPK